MNMEQRAAGAASLQSYEEARAWIEGLVPFGIRPGLERMKALLDTFGHPERRLKFIHVAGTNGKGSVCAYLTSVLIKCGYDVGTFTSPYITKFTDRFQYNGEDIPEQTVLELANEIKPQVEAMEATELGSPTMFEVSTLLAILYFGQTVFPDYVVWETGLGGRLDVTNVVTPVVSIITNVGHDHMDILGDTLEQVAREKAGIIKPGVPVVSAAADPEAVAVIREAAASCRSTLYLLGEQFHESPLMVREDEQSFRFEGIFRTIEPLTVTLNGAHQRTNAAVAVMTLEVLRQYYALIVEDADLQAGLREARWPGRLETVSREPRIVLDGAHNPEGMETLAIALRDTYSFGKLHVMIGMLANKNHRDTLRHILPLVDTLIITEPDFRKKLAADELRAMAAEAENGPADITVESDWRKALELLQRRTEPGDLAVVTGTLYLIADVRSRLLYNTDSEKGW
ncbi:folylpolyglutamate synthase [Paenibacillus darwinianus]|uniref:Dihydrofolate synthase/folylpolyglutamate synthase n=1 Tax=Paenibacillus darwinianus TaxID=1380763 RepID=A0A9W5RZ21_9BACL|nr:folylpolyglutamate synthase/dihydrofolate synthase family protein [Paenibacillus darwinianus]EXX85128.1 folylpolyglutamate synthase [Paenibacillus darwinianus]EXX90104.1 folylpolyglutamate synthase [Paenibacillus darwinianus]EXX91347.1 folylpolyglutamate synthase [Paenibacillus darwinianus]